MPENPTLILAVDNCFGYKRWTAPDEWMRIIKSLGIRYVEASADTEADPMYMGKKYMKAWTDDVKKAQDEAGMRVVNLYSGHGTYNLLGLTNPDKLQRRRLIDKWFKPMLDIAGKLECGLGFFAQGLPDWVLNDAGQYQEQYQILVEDLGELAKYAFGAGCTKISLEQMYSPHMIPFTIQGTKALIRDVYQKSGHAMYVTLDVGHMSSQSNFLRPNDEKMASWAEKLQGGQYVRGMYFGEDAVLALFKDYAKSGINQNQQQEINALMDQTPYLFSTPDDCRPQMWIEALAQYSPIIHLQQTDAGHSRHWPFSDEYNKSGIISSEFVMEGIQKSYEEKKESGMPPVCDEIALTLEPFTATASINADTLHDIETSAVYWNKYLKG